MPTVTVALVAVLAGGVAAVIRYGVSLWIGRTVRSAALPWATLLVNVAGCALAGVVLGFGELLPSDVRLILLAGVAGALTTFSTFSVETIQLAREGRRRAALVNVAANLFAGWAALLTAYAVAMALVG